jgi:hypothetical protein
MTETIINLSKAQKRQRTERILGVMAMIILVVAGIFGALRAEGNLQPAIISAIPGTDHVTQIEGDLYAAWEDPAGDALLGYVALGEASGYGGPMKVAAGFSTEGEVLGAVIAAHKETPSWINKVTNADFFEDLVGKQYSEGFVLGADVDGVTGATYTTRAIANAMLDGGHSVAAYIGLPIPEQPKPKIVIGIPEILLLVLFAMGYFGRKPGFKYRKQGRWVALIIGLVGLGFIYNSPLTLSNINKLLMGFWPDWRTNLYWYILILGILFVFTVDNKNPYCEWFCPFGAAQECMGLIGGAKTRSPGKYRVFLKWLQRGLAWGAILIALFYRNPSITSFEIFGTLFELIGTGFQFALLIIIMLASLFIRRPWCTYLCPLHPVDEFIRMTRKWIFGLWQKRKQNA